MKKIAIVFNRMILGGAEKSLIQFLRALDKDRYDITLFTRNDQGPLFCEIPKNVHVIFTEDQTPSLIFKDDLKHFRLIRVLKGLYHRIAVRFAKDDYQRFYHPMRTYRPLPGTYDCAIAYKLGCEDTAVLLARVDAMKKCGFIHHIVDKTTDGGVFNYLGPIDKVFCVSNYARSVIDRQYPHLAAKTEVIHNIIDREQILKNGATPISEIMHTPSIVTVGRLDKEKGQDMIPQTARLLKDAGCNVHWYLVGDGDLRETIMHNISLYDVADRVTLLGTKSNPYPYMARCDIYVQTSRSEGWCLTTQEAKVLSKPIITTDLPVMREQFTDGVDGLIAEATTPQALAAKIQELLDHPELGYQICRNISNDTNSATNDLQKLYDYIEH